MKLLKLLFTIFTLVSVINSAHSQELPEKVVNENAQFWISTNNVFRIADRWAILNDIHVRRTNFMADPNFYFLRVGGQYYLNSNLRLAGGYAHLWLTTTGVWDNYQNENRIYQQLSISRRYEKMNALFRIRLEQRFFNNVQDGQSLNNDSFVNRVRFLVSAGFPFRQGGPTEFILANETHLNFGKDVVFNTFNQNRFTVGIKHKLSKHWKVDCGYMMVYQQLASGNVYNLNHTLRLFFYGSFDFRKNKNLPFNEVRHGEE
ncbi:DUF2490 domain-containing protein [Winogradskyella sp. DF17]|uniref:DUF2490 domain-containing protein n=1 Tax=Winogradskyella pelagia TaxID=2819984 RepID=A0ABS3SZT9_9FLAO|nr:DUF2490 domain-containing protein [Winogradskyella sp. DF17]MBO3115995.1 DUF2490 domain-containing protein [Winogradskyella sp. DF17]